MKLDRNINDDGLGKYALLNLRKLKPFEIQNSPFQKYSSKIVEALETLEQAGILDWGRRGTENEFFLLRLKDRYAQDALYAYARGASAHDKEWANEVYEMAQRAGTSSPWCKHPD